MKIFLGFLLVSFAVGVALADQATARKPLVVYAKQRRWTARDLVEYHRQMRKIHEGYIPRYPDAPILTTVTVGTPAVTYEVSMESGSEAIFLLAKDYPGRNTSIDQPFFDPAQSSTAKEAGKYHGFSGDLEVFGQAYDDVVGLFGFDPWHNTTQQFGVVDSVLDPFSLSPQMPDGVVGLSWNPADAANPNENSSAVINLFKELGPGTARYWCQYFHDETTSEHTRDYAIITKFGGCLDEFCAQPDADNTFPLVWFDDSRSLAFVVNSFMYQEEEYVGGYAKVDTGVPLILMPSDTFAAIFADVNPAYDFDNGLYTVDCTRANKLPDWTFIIAGTPFGVPSSAYVVDLQLPGDQCALSAGVSDEETTDYVLGYVFHNLWCTKMDIDNQAISLLEVLPPPISPAPTTPPPTGKPQRLDQKDRLL